jgi:hypothetical protein
LISEFTAGKGSVTKKILDISSRSAYKADVFTTIFKTHQSIFKSPHGFGGVGATQIHPILLTGNFLISCSLPAARTHRLKPEKIIKKNLFFYPATH